MERLLYIKLTEETFQAVKKNLKKGQNVGQFIEELVAKEVTKNVK